MTSISKIFILSAEYVTVNWFLKLVLKESIVLKKTDIPKKNHLLITLNLKFTLAGTIKGAQDMTECKCFLILGIIAR